MYCAVNILVTIPTKIADIIQAFFYIFNIKNEYIILKISKNFTSL